MNEGDRVAKIMRAIEGLEKEVSNHLYMYSCYSNHVSQGTAQRTQLQAAKTHILMDNALDWKKFKVLTSLCCTYVVSIDLMLSAISMVMTFVLSRGEYGGRSISRSQCCRQFSKLASS